METVVCRNAAEAAPWMEQLSSCDWGAGRFLHRLLAEGRFHAVLGENARVIVLAEGETLAGFCTCADRDDIPGTERTPWLGFAYVRPDFRGRRLLGRLMAKAKELAREDGHDALWISTLATGLYEKHGAVFAGTMEDVEGKESRIYRADAYGFHGWETATAPAVSREFPLIETPKDLYRALWHLWRRETCAPRMQADWSEENRTCGQCSVTAFLAQDIFGGRVMGVPLGDGAFHCFNVAGDCLFDLTNEQFGGRKLVYTLDHEQHRAVHFAKAEKKARYEALRQSLLDWTRRPARA